MRNLLAIFLLVIFAFFKLNKSMETWKEKNDNFLDYDELNANYLEDKCGDNEICQNSFEDMIKRKPKETEEPAFKTDFASKKSTRLASYYHSAQPLSCYCGIEFRILDLGHQYYPRYLHTGVCKSDICGGLYRCIEKHYKVRVLKQRDPRNPEVKTSTTFPENLKSFWQPELVTVTVACECSL